MCVGVCVCVCVCVDASECVCVCVCLPVCLLGECMCGERASHSTCGAEDSVDRAFLISSRLCSSSTSPYEDSSQEEERSPLLTALTIPVCTVGVCVCVCVCVCMCVCVCVFEACRHKDSSLTDSQL